MTEAKILIVDDDEDVLQAATMLLKRHFSSIKSIPDPIKLMNLVSRESFDVVVLDMNYSRDTTSGNEGFYWMRNILALKPQTKIILMTAYGDVEKAVKAIKEGAHDFVLKPWENEKLVETISKATKIVSPSNGTVSSSPDFIGKSDAMKRVFDTIKKVATTDANVLITGENGTGKEMVANELHKYSLRKNMPLISVDLGSLSESIFESELFGHTKGSFTDAKENRIGKFEAAHQSTLFLDEIGNLSINQQAKLLTAIQNKKIVKLGSNVSIDVDVRIITATNADLNTMIREQKFRQDLYYRINTVEITIPPLRDRPEDIEALIQYYFQLFQTKYHKNFPYFTTNEIKSLQSLSWQGNVRELKQKLERAFILSDSEKIDLSFLVENEAEKSDLIDKMNIDEMEKMLISKSLKKYNGNISKAANELGLTRAALYRRIEKYAI